MYDTTVLAVLVFFGVAVVLAELLAKRTGFNAPVLLVVGGVALGFLPVTSSIRVPPGERRRVLVELRDDDLIDDEVVLRVQAELDNEELGLTGAPGPE